MSEHELRNHQECRTLTGLVYARLPDDPALGRPERYCKGDFLWTSTDAEHDVYFLKRGQVAILRNDPAGCDLIVRVIKPGEPFGELCFCSLRDQPRDDCAQATVDSDVFRVGLSAFLQYLRRDSTALENFAFTICKRLADAESRIQVLSHRGAEARLGRLLLHLADFGNPQSSNHEAGVKLWTGHDELARMSAMTRPHVTVTMSKLRERGLVSYSRASPLTIYVARLAEYLNRTR